MSVFKKNNGYQVISLCLVLSFLGMVFLGSVWAAPPHLRAIAPPHPPLHAPGPGHKPLIGPPAPWKLKGPPPAGMVWFHFRENWITVPSPPGPGPFIWDGAAWVIDPTPGPAGSEWVPGHWTDDGWVAGHWLNVPEPGPGSAWIDGHWKNGVWVSGHWKGTPPPGKTWVPGHHGPRGRWIPGHYR